MTSARARRAAVTRRFTQAEHGAPRGLLRPLPLPPAVAKGPGWTGSPGCRRRRQCSTRPRTTSAMTRPLVGPGTCTACPRESKRRQTPRRTAGLAHVARNGSPSAVGSAAAPSVCRCSAPARRPCPTGRRVLPRRVARGVFQGPASLERRLPCRAPCRGRCSKQPRTARPAAGCQPEQGPPDNCDGTSCWLGGFGGFGRVDARPKSERL